MNNREIIDNGLMVCAECELEVISEDDLLSYEGIVVCVDCYDKLRLIDEQKIQEWETEGYDYYN